VSRGPWPAPGPRTWIAAAILIAWALFFHTTFLVPDSSGNYAWARSLLFDRDVDFGDELLRLGYIEGNDRVRFHATTELGRPGNPFGMGAGLLWIPFVLLAELLLRLAGAAVSPGGYGDLHILAASAGTAVYGLAALWIGLRICVRFVRSQVALPSILACALGTPFLAYAFHLPTYAHVPAAFAVALALLAGLRARDRPSAWRWALAGAAVGLAATVRSQHVLLILLPAILWFRSERERAGRTAREGLALGAGFALVFGVQLVAWLRIYGRLGLPQGGAFLDLLRPHLVGVLLSPWHGLLSWSPILAPALAGLFLLFRRDRRLAVGLGLVTLAEVWLVASVVDWWGGYAFGARRLVDLTPVFVLGLAVALDRVGSTAARWTVAALAVAWNLALTTALRTGLLSPFREPTYGDLLAAVGGGMLRLPAYLAGELVTPWSRIHLIVHRDSPVRPVFDVAPPWLVPLGLGLCWILGLAVLRLFDRRGAPHG
jgi:hypothetical protein